MTRTSTAVPSVRTSSVLPEAGRKNAASTSPLGRHRRPDAHHRGVHIAIAIPDLIMFYLNGLGYLCLLAAQPRDPPLPRLGEGAGGEGSS